MDVRPSFPYDPPDPMFTLVRAVTYATLFAGLLLWFAPAAILGRTGVRAPASFGLLQVLGIAVGVAGLVMAAGCVLAFATLGKGTPAPFDPPRRLVMRGPYRLLRNPMYLGAALWVLGLTLFYSPPGSRSTPRSSWPARTCSCCSTKNRRCGEKFGDDYRDYCRRVGRWF